MSTVQELQQTGDRETPAVKRRLTCFSPKGISKNCPCDPQLGASQDVLFTWNIFGIGLEVSSDSKRPCIYIYTYMYIHIYIYLGFSPATSVCVIRRWWLAFRWYCRHHRGHHRLIACGLQRLFVRSNFCLSEQIRTCFWDPAQPFGRARDPEGHLMRHIWRPDSILAIQRSRGTAHETPLGSRFDFVNFKWVGGFRLERLLGLCRLTLVTLGAQMGLGIEDAPCIDFLRTIDLHWKLDVPKIKQIV